MQKLKRSRGDWDEKYAARLDRAERDLRFYADVLCRDNPDRYDVRQTMENTETRLADSIRLVLSSRQCTERQRFEAMGYNISTIEEACDEMDRLSSMVRFEVIRRMTAEYKLEDSATADRPREEGAA